MVPPVLKVLAMKGLSLVGKESTLSGETKEGNEDGDDDELNGVTGSPSREEPVNPRVTWLPQDLGDARVFLRVVTLAAWGSSSIGWVSSSLTCANAEADSFINCLV